MRQYVTAYCVKDQNVSIHAPVKDATSFTEVGRASNEGFNPRTRKGCDKSIGCPPQKLKVSIHAPVKDATIGHNNNTPFFLVSIHAPVKDATFRRMRHRTAEYGFNPRTRKGCDF